MQETQASGRAAVMGTAIPVPVGESEYPQLTSLGGPASAPSAVPQQQLSTSQAPPYVIHHSWFRAQGHRGWDGCLGFTDCIPAGLPLAVRIGLSELSCAMGASYAITPTTSLPSRNMSLPLSEHLFQAINDKTCRDEFVDLFSLLYRGS